MIPTTYTSTENVNGYNNRFCMKQNISVVIVFVVCNYKLSQMLAYLRLCLEEEKENGEENILTITIKD